MVFLGIDYGHGETSAACYDEVLDIHTNSHLVNLDVARGKKKIFSVILQKVGNINEPVYVVGDDATIDNLMEATDYCVCFKGDVSSSSELSERQKVFLGHFMKKIYKNVLDFNSRIGNEHKVYIACPTEWHKTRSIVENYKQHAISYGVPVVQVFIESAAAYYRMRGMKVVEGGITIGEYKGVIVIDFGSSTVDFTYFNQIDTPINKGYSNGASRVEDVILKHALESEPSGIDAKQFIDQFKETGRDFLRLKCRKFKEDFYGSDKEYRRYNLSIDLDDASGRDPKFQDKVFKNREKYSDNYIIQLLEKEGYLDDLRKMLKDFKQEIGDHKIQYVFLTGGASNMDFFIDMVCAEYNVVFKKTCYKDDTPSTTISQGIAALAEATWRWEKEEKKLRDDVKKWINMDKLRSLINEECQRKLKTILIEKIHKTLKEYEDGQIVWQGKREIGMLEVALKGRMPSYACVSEKDMDLLIEKINNEFMKGVGNDINKKIAEIWKVQYKTSNLRIDIRPDVKVKTSILEGKIHSTIIQGLKNCYGVWWYGETENTMGKDRDDYDRAWIVYELNKQFSSMINGNISNLLEFNFSAVEDSASKNIDNYLDRSISFAKLDALNT